MCTTRSCLALKGRFSDARISANWFLQATCEGGTTRPIRWVRRCVLIGQPAPFDTPPALVIQEAVSQNRASHTLLLCGLVFAAFKLPAHALAYGDPSGGLLFQMLTPLVAVLWGGWLILAGGVRKRVGRLIGRFRSATPEDDGESLKSTSEAD